MAAKKSVQLSGIVVAESAICSIDPDEGVLMYRGYDIADLAEHSTYEETALLLLDGELPSSDALASFESNLADQRRLPDETVELIDRSATAAVPMDLLRTAVSTLAFSDPGSGKIDAESGRRTATRLIAQLPAIVGRYQRRRQGLEPVEPDPSLSYAENFLTMLRGATPTEEEARAFDVAMIVHAEHEMNASTFTARVVAGTLADLHSAVVAAICALKGPIHGGANEQAMALFVEAGAPERAADVVRARFERKQTVYGFGHPLYVTMDPRATILKRWSETLSLDGGEPNWFAITDAVEQAVREQKGLWPNVDLYSGSLYSYLGIPTDLFTPLFECSRVAGQAAHVLEQHADNKIIRPGAEYVGPEPRDYPVASRS